MHKTVDKYEEKLEGFVDSLARKIEPLARERRTNTPKQRQQASSARYEAHCLTMAKEACEKMLDGVRSGTLPESLRLKSMADICKATKPRLKQFNGSYGEYYASDDEFYSDDPIDVELRNWVFRTPSSEEAEQRKAKLALDAELSQIRGLKIDGFFPTPDDIVRSMMMPLCHQMEGRSVLEPSAGIGSIAEVAREYGAGEIVCFEVVPRLCKVLEMKGFKPFNDDFLTCAPVPEFDYVLMNPPYENNQAIDHVMHAYKFLGDGGRLLAVLPTGMARYEDSKIKKRQAWAQWLDQVRKDPLWYPTQHVNKVQWLPIPEGAFKSAFNPTGISVALLRIDR